MSRIKEIPFHQRVTCTITQAEQVSGLGRRKINQWIADERVESFLADGRRVLSVPSFLKALTAGAGAPRVEPVQLRRAREARMATRPESSQSKASTTTKDNHDLSH